MTDQSNTNVQSVSNSKHVPSEPVKRKSMLMISVGLLIGWTAYLAYVAYQVVSG